METTKESIILMLAHMYAKGSGVDVEDLRSVGTLRAEELGKDYIKKKGPSLFALEMKTAMRNYVASNQYQVRIPPKPFFSSEEKHPTFKTIDSYGFGEETYNGEDDEPSIKQTPDSLIDYNTPESMLIEKEEQEFRDSQLEDFMSTLQGSSQKKFFEDVFIFEMKDEYLMKKYELGKKGFNDKKRRLRAKLVKYFS